ncbi:MAG: CAP domain-containing protein [Chitinophagales bacterium]
MSVKFPVAILIFVLMNSCFIKPRNQSSTASNSYEKESTVDRPVDRGKAGQTINPNRFDDALLEVLVHEEINRLRSKKRRATLENDNCLRKAAMMQNDYVMRLGKLSHNQRSKERKGVMERSRVFGCTHLMVGENLQFMGFTLVKQNGKLIDIETPTYAQAARDIAENWKNSPSHYDNLIHKSFFRVGTVVAYDSRKKGIYATQVFGAVPPSE